MSGWKRGDQLLTEAEKLIIERELLEDEVITCLHGLYGTHRGKETQLARRYSVSRQRINQIKRKLSDTQLFYHRLKHAFVGRAGDGRFFLVDEIVWKKSVHEGIVVTGLSKQDAVELNLDPANWENLVGTRGVSYWTAERK